MTTPWVPKPGGTFTWSRLSHLLVGVAVPTVAGVAWGDHGAAVGGTVVVGFGLTWELGTRTIARLGGERVTRSRWHKHPDFKDYLAYLLGATVGVGIRAMM